MRIVLLASIIAAVVIVTTKLQEQAEEISWATGEDYGIADVLADTVDEVAGTVTYTELADMYPSEELKRIIKTSEGLKLQPYDLGDGGWTVGYGHFSKSKPAAISLAEAEAMFNDDLETRAAKWVRLYVTAPMTQNEFDALVHIAYNMSPRSFKKFADSVNAGQGIRDIAAQSVGWVAAHLQNGIRNRRNREINLYENGVYA